MNGPRQDIEAEKAVIGSVLVEPRVLEDITLRSEDFYRPQHEQLWDIILTERTRESRPSRHVCHSTTWM